MASDPKPKIPGKSFLWLRASTSSNLGKNEPRSSWTTTDSGNSESILPMSTATNDNPSRKPSSSRLQPSTSFTKPMHHQGTSYPPPSNSSLTPSPAHHARSLTTSTSASSQGGPTGSAQSHSTRAHPYQLAAYDSFNYRGSNLDPILQSEAIETSEQYPNPNFPVVKPDPSSYEKLPISPQTPMTALPSRNLLPDVDGRQKTELEWKRQQRRSRRQSLRTVTSLRLLNSYNVSPAMGAIAPALRFGVPSDPQSAAISAIIIGSVLALPVVLSVVYISVGHSILRTARQNDNPLSIYTIATLLSSVQAAAAGAGILAVPILLVLYLLGVFPPKGEPSDSARDPSQNGSHQRAGDDFFDDYSDGESSRSTCGTSRLIRFGTYALCAVLLIGVGGATGSLGVTVLSSTSLDGIAADFVLGRKVFLSPGAAAAAGLVGGCVICGGLAVLFAMTVGTLILLARIENAPPLDR